MADDANRVARYYHPWAFRFEHPRIAGGRTRRVPSLLDGQAAAHLRHSPDPLGSAFQLYFLLDQPETVADDIREFLAG